MKLYNTLSREIEEFKPIEEGKVRLYACGLTVYSQPHIGNWVAYIYWDVLVRTLKASGYEVNHVQNITDVGHLTSDEDAGEDKMLKGALREGKTAWEVADKYIAIAGREAYEELGLLHPTHLPRATEYISQQIDFVGVLEEKGYTYQINDGIYFDTGKLTDYGKLARLDIDGLQFGKRVEMTGKKNPTDFAVWKFSPKNEKRDMEWESPWGKGFPGWHLECSVMIRELLGDTIDIHTGGIDHIPVHHTNEIAQSETVTGQPLAHYWLHANHIKVNGTKISKSLGNGFTLDDIKQRGIDLAAFKLMVLGKHYRTEGNFTWEILEAAQNLLTRFEAAADLRFQPLGSEVWLEAALAEHDILEDLQNDLKTPAAIMKLSSLLNQLEDKLINTTEVEVLGRYLNAVDNLLGLELSKRQDINQFQKELLTGRAGARNKQDWVHSDELRNQLKDAGLTARDTERGQVWSRI